MTIDEEVRTLVKVCRLLVVQMRDNDIKVWGTEQSDTCEAIDLLDAIDTQETPHAE